MKIRDVIEKIWIFGGIVGFGAGFCGFWRKKRKNDRKDVFFEKV